MSDTEQAALDAAYLAWLADQTRLSSWAAAWQAGRDWARLEAADRQAAEVGRLRAALDDARCNFEWLISGASGLSRLSHADTTRARLDARDGITTVLCRAISEIDAALYRARRVAPGASDAAETQSDR